MHPFLFQLGRGAARRHWVVITIWHVTSVIGPFATAGGAGMTARQRGNR